MRGTLFLFLVLIAGCSNPLSLPDNQGKIAAVSGFVLDGDKPVANARILMLPLGSSDGSAPARWSYAETNEQGRFTMRLKSNIFGAHVGENLVLISTAQSELIKKEKESPKANGKKTATRTLVKDKTPDREPSEDGDPEDGDPEDGDPEGEKSESDSAPKKEVANENEGSDEKKTPNEEAADAKETAAVQVTKETEATFLKLMKGTGLSVKEFRTIQSETIPEEFNRRSQLTFNVRAKGNSGITFRIDKPVSENPVTDKSTSAEESKPVDNSKSTEKSASDAAN